MNTLSEGGYVGWDGEDIPEPLNHSSEYRPDELLYPCAVAGCKVLRTRSEGGGIFTVCDECWEKNAEAERKAVKE